MNTISESSLESVFWHELGHFIAYTICYQEFKILKVERVQFFQKKGPDSVYSGLLSGALPKDPTIDYHNYCMPERITTTLYGCIFESIFTGRDFETCFNSLPAIKDRRSFLDESSPHSKEIEHLTVEYAADLRLKNYFSQLEFKNFVSFFGDSDEEDSQIVYYIVDSEVTRLELMLQPFLRAHKPDYLQYLHTVRTIMNWDKKPIPMIYD